MRTIAEFKLHPLFSLVSQTMNELSFRERNNPLLHVLVAIKYPEASSRKELDYQLKEWKKTFDYFFISTKYSEFRDYDEVIFIRTVIELIREFEKTPFDLQQFVNLITYFLSQTEEF